jgi:hypothetical protein
MLTQRTAVPAKKEIVIIPYGWVFLGLVKRHNDHLTITEAYNIRVWGTTSGLGEIALNGPTPTTLLDLYGTIEIPMSQVLCRIECKETI